MSAPYQLSAHRTGQGEKIRAELRPNHTINHHFLAQAEQRQYAFNTHVNPRNQNIYRFARTELEYAESINIENNLQIDNLYTLAQHSDTQQYNLETWFNRYESGYARICAELRQLPSKSPEPPLSLHRLLQLKLLDILRNPYNDFPTPLQKPIAADNIIQQIARRETAELQKVLAETEKTQAEYLQWLAELYCLLSDNLHQPNYLEQHTEQLFFQSKAAITLYRQYQGNHRYYLPDTAHLLENEQLWLPVAADLILHIDFSLHSHSKKLSLYDNVVEIYQHHNQLAVEQSRYYVYGKSQKREDYQ